MEKSRDMTSPGNGDVSKSGWLATSRFILALSLHERWRFQVESGENERRGEARDKHRGNRKTGGLRGRAGGRGKSGKCVCVGGRLSLRAGLYERITVAFMAPAHSTIPHGPHTYPGYITSSHNPLPGVNKS